MANVFVAKLDSKVCCQAGDVSSRGVVVNLEVVADSENKTTPHQHTEIRMSNN